MIDPNVPLITPDQFNIVDDWVNKKEKIKAIKELRIAAGIGSDGTVNLGLKDAKDYIDNWPTTRGLFLLRMENKRGLHKGKPKYIGTKENNLAMLMEMGKLDFDEDSLQLLEQDLKGCSEYLLRWFVYRLAFGKYRIEELEIELKNSKETSEEKK